MEYSNCLISSYLNKYIERMFQLCAVNGKANSEDKILCVLYSENSADDILLCVVYSEASSEDIMDIMLCYVYSVC